MNTIDKNPDNPSVISRDSEENGYVGRIKASYSSLSKAQKRIANYILKNQEAVAKSSITMIAKKTGTTPSTVTRFCQALSYKGFNELKVYVEKNLLPFLSTDSIINKNDGLHVILQKLAKSSYNAFFDTLHTLDPRSLIRTVNNILSAEKIIILGQSGGYISALYAQQLLLRVNISTIAANDVVDMKLLANTLGKGDVAIAISYSGEAHPTIDALTIAKKNKASIIVITASPSSTIAKMADEKLLYSYNIPDDLQYSHLASICEIEIIGAIQAEILRRPVSTEKIEVCKKAVLASRKKK